MPSFSNVRRFHHPADKVYELIADVEKYPQFLPLCEALVIKTRRQEDGRTILTADMTVAYKFVRETYTSKVQLIPAERKILVEYINGPFRRLDNRWHVREVDEKQCDVDFYIDYEFRSRPLQMLMGAMFDKAFHRFSDAFAQRADEIYGRK